MFSLLQLLQEHRKQIPQRPGEEEEGLDQKNQEICPEDPLFPLCGIFVRTHQQPCSLATSFQQQSQFKALSTMSGEYMCSAKIHPSQQLQLCTFPSKVSCKPKLFLLTEKIFVDLKASAQRRTVIAILRAVSNSC